MSTMKQKNQMLSKIKLHMFLLVFGMISSNCVASVEQHFPKTAEFAQAVKNRNKLQCMAMLSQSEIVAQIDFNQVEDGYLVWHQVIKACHLEDVALQILDIKNSDGSLKIHLNHQVDFFGSTGLRHAFIDFQPRLIFKILSLKDTNELLLANINLEDFEGTTALTDAAERWYYETTYGPRPNDVNRKAWIAAIIKKLLLLGANITCSRKSGMNATLIQKTPLSVLSLCESQIKDPIFLIFNALKAGIDVKKLTLYEQIIIDAYDQMLHGDHDELRNQLLVLPAMLCKRIPLDLLVVPLFAVFKAESIKPLLCFLAEKRYQRKMVDLITRDIKLGQ